MRPALNGSFTLEHIECSNAIEICNRSVQFLPGTATNSSQPGGQRRAMTQFTVPASIMLMQLVLPLCLLSHPLYPQQWGNMNSTTVCAYVYIMQLCNLYGDDMLSRSSEM